MSATTSAQSRPLRVIMVGWGAVARAAAAELDPGVVDVVGVGVRRSRSGRPELPAGAQLITDPSEVADLQPDVVAEAAGRESVADWGRAALPAGADYVVSSASAFVDADLLAELRLLAEQHNTQLQIQPGAVGGIDALAAARSFGLDHVEHQIIKPPAAWVGTPAETCCNLGELTEAEAFLSGSAAAVAAQYAKNANVAMTVALAGVGPTATQVTLIADPTVNVNRHRIVAQGRFGQLDVTISNLPLPDNPKSSALAALGLARAITNRGAALAI
jgi:aspartate dehydrogenase